MIPPHKHHAEDSVDSWLMSYADMITLLMCFFIIFVSVSEPKKERISAITNGMAGKFGTVDLSTPFQGAYRSLQEAVENNHVLKEVAVEKTEHSIEIELASNAFFKPNSADFDPAKMPVLNDLVEALKKVDFIEYRIVVESHTSDMAPQSGIYPTNWELSGARSARLVRLFIEHGIKPNLLEAVGLGDSAPKVPNKDINGNAIPENRARNERTLVKLERLS